jgi:IS4 transposase
LTNNSGWSARTIAELYRARWAVELFFKKLKRDLIEIIKSMGQQGRKTQ